MTAAGTGLRRIGADTTLDGDLEQILRQATEELAAVIRFDIIEFVALTRNSIHRMFGLSPDGFTEVESEHAALTCFSDLLSESHYPIIVDEPGERLSEASVLLVPLRVHNRLVGMVLLWRYEGKHFSGDDLYPVMTLTGSAFEKEAPRLWKKYEEQYANAGGSGTDLTLVLKKADAELYRAKQNGRNRVCPMSA